MIKIHYNYKRKDNTAKEKDKERYNYLSYIISTIFYSIIKRKKCHFFKKLHLYDFNYRIQSYDKNITKDKRKNNEIVEYKYQKNEKKIINIKKEDVINLYDNDNNGEYRNKFDLKRISIIKNDSFSFINNNTNNNIDFPIPKNNIKEISYTNKINTNINENTIDIRQKLKKTEFEQNNLSMNNNFSISFFGDGINKQKNLCENNKSLNNKTKTKNLEQIKNFHSFNKNDLSIDNTASFSYIKNKILLNIDLAKKYNNNIKNELDIVNKSIKSIKEKIILMDKYSEDNKINIKNNKNNESNIYIIEESINNKEINDKNKKQNDNKDINDNLKIISQPKSLQKIKDKKSKKGNDKDSINKIPSENNRANLINYGDYSKDSNSIEEAKNKSSFIIKLNDKYKNLFNPIKKNIYSIQNFLLKKIFLKLWYKQSIKMKNAKRGHKKDKKILSGSNMSFNSNNNNNKSSANIIIGNKKSVNIRHLLLLNLMKFVIDKIKKEVKRRKLIICFKDINLLKYPNLRFALRKIKKYAKVRYRVMNEFASLIQNAFRFYLENKNKENQNEAANSNKQIIHKENK